MPRGKQWASSPATVQLVVLVASCVADNPLVPDVGMADPHIHIFDNTAYLYTTQDKSRHATDFEMPGWNVWRSSDLIQWKHLTSISPQQTYIAKQQAAANQSRVWTAHGWRLSYSGVLACFAADIITTNGVYAFFFSNGDTNMGVMTASSPSLSDAVDAIGGPLVSTKSVPTIPPGITVTDQTHGAYDPTLLLDDDGITYVCFGVHRPDGHDGHPSDYLLARLSDSLTGFAETPRTVKFLPHPRTGKVMPGGDKSTLHKWKGLYYLSAGTHYATAKNVYGPYTFRGDTNPHVQPTRSFGLTGQAHGRFFEWRGQWFHVWCQFVDQNNTGVPVQRRSYHFFRDSWMTYVHYGHDGEMVDDWNFLDLHGTTGVGRYDASWSKIEAEWYMAATGCEKVQVEAHHAGVLPPTSFAVRFLSATSTLLFPNVENLPRNATLTLAMRGVTSGGVIRVHSTRDSEGPALATCSLHAAGSTATCAFKRGGQDGGTDGLKFTFEPPADAARALLRRMSQLAPEEALSGAEVELDWWSLVK